MNADPAIRLSVLVPVYGVEPYIAACARSLFGQSVREGVEFLFVDDASPDGSIAVLERVVKEFPQRQTQIRILHHATNRGLAAARRTAIDAARGEWLLHVDSDDMLLPGALEKLLAAAGTHPGADLIYAGYVATENPAVAPMRGKRVNMPQWNRERILHTLLAQTHRINNRLWGMLIRRSLFTANGIYPVEGINFAEDYAVTPRLVHAAREVAVIPDTLYAYREAREGSYMKRLDDRAAAQYVAANRAVEAYMKAQPDYATYRNSIVLGRLNIEKWILLRGLQPAKYDPQLFADGDRPRKVSHRLYAAAIRSGIRPLARLLGMIFKYAA